MKRSPLPAGYFRDLYAASSDPWNLGCSEYERQKYQATLAAMPERRFRNGFEIGCAIGVLTRLLAQRTDNLLAIDIEDVALQQARSHCADLANVRFEQMKIPGQWPEQEFDFIILSEVLYYLSPEDITEISTKCRIGCAENAVVMLVHWTHPTDLPLDGDEAVQLFLDAAAPDLVTTRQKRTDDYRIDVLAMRSSLGL
jgi:2-polyprenyl-3-methyl-5-hydroxy-6-metoxy-1,4-benzoquinol methylase